MKKVILIDLSSISHPAWHISQADPDPNATSIKTIEAVRRLAGSEPYVAVCCEGGRSFRKDLDPEYKATRPAQDAALTHQVKLAMETLANDGFPVWSVKGFEADDVLASACDLALAMWEHPDKPNAEPAFTLEILSSDKDLLQLVGERVSVRSIATGKYYDTTGVIEKLGVNPTQVVDWLALVGDTADNIKGARGVGPKRATELLTKYGNLEDMFKALTEHGTDFTPALATALREFEPRMQQVRELITLRRDVVVPFTEIFKPRTPEEAIFSGEDEQPSYDQLAGPPPPPATQAPLQFPSRATEMLPPADPMNENRPGDDTKPAPPEPNGMAVKVAASQPPPPVLDPVGPAAPTPPVVPGPAPTTPTSLAPPTGTQAAPPTPASAIAIVDQPALAPLEFERQLEPRSMQQAGWVAEQLFKSRLFSAYGTPQGILSTILAGRDFGLSASASLRGFNIIDGKPAMAADLIRAIVLRSGVAEYFRPTERTATKATFVAKRKGEPEISLTYTIEEGRQAWSRDERAWNNSGWGKSPADMLVARASSKLARLVFPDVTFGLYDPSELDGGQ